jgi:hypothetical protein
MGSARDKWLFFVNQPPKSKMHQPAFIWYTIIVKNQPKPIADLIGPDDIEHLALRSNLRYGQAIYKRGGVEFIKFTPLEVEGWVGGLNGSVAEGGSQRRRTQLNSTLEGLKWNCTGNPKNHQIFCKHCVALAMAVRDKTDKPK